MQKTKPKIRAYAITGSPRQAKPNHISTLVPFSRPPNTKILSMLQDLTEQAERGEISSIIIGGANFDGSTVGGWYIDAFPLAAIGEVEFCKQEVFNYLRG